MAKKKTEIVQVPETAEVTVIDSFIEKAISVGAPIETLERLFDLQQKAKAAKAKEAFVVAMAKFQSECPVIEKKRTVKNYDGSIRYKFAPIDVIVEQIRVPVASNGFSYRWESQTKDGNVIAKCIATHSLGHSESSEFTAPIEDEKLSKSGNALMTAPQRTAVALTYAKRYSLLDAFGIATADEDTDGTSAKQKDAKDPKAQIMFRLRTLGEKTETGEQIKEAVSRLAKLDLVPDNFNEIITRLEVLISEKHENN